MRGIRDPQLSRLLVHLLDKRLVRAGTELRESKARVCAGAEDTAVEQFDHRDLLTDHIAHHAAPVDKAVVRDLPRHREGAGGLAHLLRGDEQGQHLGHRGGVHFGVGVLLGQDLPALRVGKDGKFAHDLVRKVNRLSRLAEGIGPLDLFVLVGHIDGLRLRRRLGRRRIIARGNAVQRQTQRDRTHHAQRADQDAAPALALSASAPPLLAALFNFFVFVPVHLVPPLSSSSVYRCVYNQHTMILPKRQ